MDFPLACYWAVRHHSPLYSMPEDVARQTYFDTSQTAQVKCPYFYPFFFSASTFPPPFARPLRKSQTRIDNYATLVLPFGYEALQPAGKWNEKVGPRAPLCPLRSSTLQNERHHPANGTLHLAAGRSSGSRRDPSQGGPPPSRPPRGSANDDPLPFLTVNL